MKYFKVKYNNYNFRTSTLVVSAMDSDIAIELCRRYENGQRFEVPKVEEITQSEYLSFENEAFKQEEIRF